MKKVLAIFISMFILGLGFTQAQYLMPEGGSSVGEYVSGVTKGGHVMEEQRNLIKSGTLSLGDQLASGIMGWDAILDYCVYLVKFLGEVALLIGALAIIFLGYKRITKEILGNQPKGLTMVVIGILVIIFAYVIVKLIWSAFIS